MIYLPQLPNFNLLPTPLLYAREDDYKVNCALYSVLNGDQQHFPL